MKTNSDIRPKNIRADIIKKGSVRLECAWDVVEHKIKNEGGSTRTTYDYESGIIWWALPEPDYIVDRNTLSEIGELYIKEHMVEIMGWVQAKGAL